MKIWYMYRGELYLHSTIRESSQKETQQTYSITVMCPDYKYNWHFSTTGVDGRPHTHLKRINAGHAGVCVCFRDYRYESREITSSSSSSSRIINFEIRREQPKQTRLVVSTVKEVSQYEYREPVSSAPHHPLLRRRSNGTCLCCERNSVVSRKNNLIIIWPK